MPAEQSAFPQFPPGFWRRIVLHPGQGWIGGAVEDDMHHFRLRFDHADGVIVGSALVRCLFDGEGGIVKLRSTAEALAADDEDIAQLEEMEKVATGRTKGREDA